MPFCLPSNEKTGVLRTTRCWLHAAVLVPSALLGAVHATDQSPSYHITVWTAEEGLPQNSVTSIVQTGDGYLWAGTFNGLARFDGVQFKVLEPGNTPSLPSAAIVSLFENPQGNLWMGTVEGDIAQRCGELVTGYRQSDRGVDSRAPRAFAQAPDGSLLMLTFDWQLMRFAGGKFSLVSTNWGLQGRQVFGLAGDSVGQVWIGTDGELALWRNGDFVAVWNQKDESGFGVSWLAPSRAGGCWTVSNGRVRRFADGNWVAEAGVCPRSKAIVDSMCEGHRGQVWVATYGNGLFCFETNGTMQRFSVTNGLPSDFVRCVYQDREGNIWVGTEGGGLARLKPSIFRSYDRKAGLSGECVLSVCEGDEGEVWIGTNGDGINRVKDGAIRQYGTEQGLTNEFVWSVYQDRNKRVWAGTWGGGLFRLEGERFVSVAGARVPLVVCALYEDSKGGLWLGQQRAEPVVMQLCADKPVPLPLPTTNLRADVRAVAEDRAGNLWIGTYDDGLYRVKDRQISRFGISEGLKSDRIRALYADPEGALWVGTSRGGLSRLKEGRFVAFTARDGLVDDFIMHIEEDRHKNLWCSTAVRGVFRVDKDELDRVARGESKTIRCFSYTRADGLPSLECTGGCQPSGCKTWDGRLWFPTVAGLAVVDPEAVPVNPLPPPVIIEEVVLEEGKARNSIFPSREGARTGDRTQGRDSGDSASLRVPPGKRRFEFRYTGLSFTAPEKVRFKYKLEGLEEDWVDAGTKREAHYGYLLPGRYTFRVQACNNDGVWNESGASLAMIILPQFWQTGWFRAAAVGLVLLLFVAGYELRLAAERRLTRLRLRIARDLHDEVGSNLGSIVLLGEVLQRQSEGPPEEVSEIRRVATQTVESLRDIVWFLDPASDNIAEMVLRMKECTRIMLPGIPFEFLSNVQGGVGKASLELRRNLFPMFKEILHNAARHARATRVEISVEVNARQLVVRVRDNGIGFDEVRVRHGNGLKNLRRRAADLEGKIEITSRAGGGTAVTLRAPVT